MAESSFLSDPWMLRAAIVLIFVLLGAALIIAVIGLRRAASNSKLVAYVFRNMLAFLRHFMSRVSSYETEEERAQANKVVDSLHGLFQSSHQLVRKINLSRHPSGDMMELVAQLSFPFTVVAVQAFEEFDAEEAIKMVVLSKMNALNGRMRFDEATFREAFDAMRKLGDTLGEIDISLKPLGLTEEDLNGQFRSERENLLHFAAVLRNAKEQLQQAQAAAQQ